MKILLMRSRIATVVLVLPWVASTSTVSGDAVRGGRTFLGGGLQPEAVALTLARVEDEWRTQAATFAECGENRGTSKDCEEAQQSFGKSCATVVNAIVKGSSGDQNRVQEYMQVVCSQTSLAGGHHDRCLDLKRAIEGELQFNEYANRVHFNARKLCTSFWSTFAVAEQKRAKAKALAEKKRQEDERAAQKEMLIRANEHAQVLAEKKRKEEARQQALKAHRQALEAKEKAAKARKEAAERLVRKKAEAEALAIAAQQKVRKAAVETAKAAEDHRRKMLEHQRAEEHLRNITTAHHLEAASANASSFHDDTLVKPAVITNITLRLAAQPVKPIVVANVTEVVRHTVAKQL